MFNYEYLTPSQLKGLDTYQYKGIDSSPFSNYVMHPIWDTLVKVIPKWVAPNTLTVTGFCFLMSKVLLLMMYDYEYHAADSNTGRLDEVPSLVYIISGVFLFLYYILDGLDGKQARRVGATSPVGELLDHGLDSFAAFCIPYSMFSLFGRDEYSVSMFRFYLSIICVVSNSYLAHCNQYMTGVLYLPWGYDISIWICSTLFLTAGFKGPTILKTHFGCFTIYNILEIASCILGTATTLFGFGYNFAIDTSPLSKYVMHPTWNFVVKFIPKCIAPNLLTFAGFLCMVACTLLLLVYDIDNTAAGRPGSTDIEESTIPNVIFTICAALVFLAYNLDGLDGKQARKLGLSGPLGELFDHGLDSYIVFLIPFCAISAFGRDVYSISEYRAFLVLMSIVLNFYVSHWEKYNTGTLYLPWGYDFSMWVSIILLLLPGLRGPSVYKVHVLGAKFTAGLELAIHATGLLTTLPVSIYNVYLSYKNKTGKMYPLTECLRPVWSMLVLCVTMSAWALWSPNNIMEKDLKIFYLTFGTVFSNIASRLIVAEMSEQRCDMVSWINAPLLATVVTSLYLPQLERVALYAFLLFAIAAHVHYGVCVVRQMCGHFKIKCFIVPKEKRK